MRRVSRAQAADFMRRAAQGQLSGLDPNTNPVIPNDAPDDYVFNPPPGAGLPVGAPGQGYTAGGGIAPLFVNHNTFTPYAFQINLFINQNYRRTALLIQNLSTSTDILVINFGSAANATNGMQLQAGEGFLFDVITPNNSVYGTFLTTTDPTGFAFEGIYGVTPI